MTKLIKSSTYIAELLKIVHHSLSYDKEATAKILYVKNLQAKAKLGDMINMIQKIKLEEHVYSMQHNLQWIITQAFVDRTNALCNNSIMIEKMDNQYTKTQELS